MAVVLAAILLVFAASAGRLLVVDAPQPSDVILVLAGETDHRPARAVQLLQQGYARSVVIDVPAEARVFGSTELQLAEKYVQSLPQASAIRICPIEGLSTRDESHDAAKCLAREDAEFGTHWWTHREWAKTCLGEWERLIWWDALERWK